MTTRPLRTTCTALAVLALATVAPVAGASTRSRAAAPHRASLLTQTTATAAFTSLWTHVAVDVTQSDGSKDLATRTTPGVYRVMYAESLCGCLYVPPTSTTMEITASLETSYPLSFTVELDDPKRITYPNGHTPATSPTLVIVTIARATAKAPWLVANYLVYGGTEKILSRTTASTMATAPVAGSPLKSLFLQLIDAMQSARTTGSIPAANVWSHATQPSTAIGALFAQLKADYHEDVTSHEKFANTYTLSNSQRTVTVPGGVMQCAEIDGRGIYSHGTFVQPANQSVWGTLVPPGTYSSITYKSARDVCLLRRTDGQPYDVGITGGSWTAAVTKKG